MQDSWPNLERVRALVRVGLGILGDQEIAVAPVPGRTRNIVYHVTSPTDAYIKLYVDAVSDNSWARECAALDALVGTLPVPRVIARRTIHGGDPPFLITSACAGRCFSGFIDTATDAEVRSVLWEIDVALRKLADDAQLRRAFENRSANLVNSHAADFSPTRWIELNAPDFLPLVRGLPATSTLALHGSMGGDNILIDVGGVAPILSALIDFEGCRIGPAGLDQAMLWYDLKLHDHSAAANHWLELVLQGADRRLIAGFIGSAAWLSAVRSTRAHPERLRDKAIRAEVRQALAALVERTGSGLSDSAVSGTARNVR